jgi:hypothetical protein
MSSVYTVNKGCQNVGATICGIYTILWSLLTNHVCQVQTITFYPNLYRNVYSFPFSHFRRHIHVTNEMGQIWIFSWILRLKTGFFYRLEFQCVIGTFGSKNLYYPQNHKMFILFMTFLLININLFHQKINK